ncbi:hypothetical protein A3A14_01175 [Candidatus Daviesbacteria bacterium RIFCSPLOWO2_01_FULL_43_38]|uniref:SpoVT-AbrB domain-containing protein n=1 Tax=Candidatus Daviesbacteria bacterium RIFCSPHIGHO2_12_FULL_43_11 TaxID=1797780 RepID=A0A1F5K1L0_9BACT|nr:MAG: hypothetical protein A2874_01780 [Candidatus Daviesbacteria bacterium RIFCSPHIGHO2_01_FULL_43_17]OGE34802.1 MAG: hypothetical protein A3E45_02395 [Candidatus Daviesbacteria bacterium RIFCSPHIGHO2_12_FULL_43_11]OGE63212.1 MAG: hypothetical protein A3A14_01175 [Candidatus Daviesbacteria bacterium RIFCSPLOWO2_01_FULL_43_38]OGE69152.1 MAG: hypothetical protein A3J21_01975 [Candidatus Daviesbacteria bacterium RIFCSPLOWO2_02_FULL_43_11]
MYTVSITSQGQITIPAKLRRSLGFDKNKKALVREENGELIIKPVQDLLELEGSFKTNLRFTPHQIREAFGEYLAQEAVRGLK